MEEVQNAQTLDNNNICVLHFKYKKAYYLMLIQGFTITCTYCFNKMVPNKKGDKLKAHSLCHPSVHKGTAGGLWADEH